MAPLVRALAAASAGLGAWLTCGALALAGDTAPHTRLGLLPPLWTLGVAVALAVAAVTLLRPSPARVLPLFASLVLVLPWLPGNVPAALLAWTGPVTWAVWAAIAVAMWAAGPAGSAARWRPAWAGDPRRAPLVVAVVATVAFCATAVRFAERLPDGDEPHYLIITQSLLTDGDLRIENNTTRGDYRAYFGRPLPLDFLQRGVDGQVYSVHAPGLAVLIAPAFAVGGYPAVVVFLAILVGAGLGVAWRLAWRLTGDAGAAWFGTAAVGLSSAYFFHGFVIFPDPPAAVIVLSGVGALWRRPDAPRWGWTARGALLAGLPWLHTRYVILAGALGLLLVARILRRPRHWPSALAFLAVPAASALCWFGFFWVIYGTPDPSAPYGDYTQSALGNLRRGVPGLFLDQQFGLVGTAPVLGLALVGIGVLLAGRARRPDAGAPAPDTPSPPTVGTVLVVLWLACLVPAAAYHMWWAGASPPARFLVPVVLTLVLPAAAAWTVIRARATRVVAWGLLLLTVAMTLVGATVERGRFVYNERDGYSRLLEWAGPVADLPRALPSLFRGTPGLALAEAFVWMVMVAAAWLALRAWDRGERRTVGTLVTGALLAAVVTASAGLAAGWALDGTPGAKPNASRLAALRMYDARIRRFGIVLAPQAGPVLASPAEILTRLDVSSEGRQAPPSPELLVVGPLPAGVYEAEVAGAVAGEGHIRLVVGREGPAIETWKVGGQPGRDAPSAHRIVLPVAVRGMVARVEGAVTSARLVLRPERLAGPGDRPSEGLAQAGARYGDVTVFLVGDGAFVEPGGLWVRAGRAATLVVGRDGGGAVRLRLRNAPVENRVRVEVGRWRETWTLAPEEEREILVPAPTGARRPVVSIAAERGFRPSEINPASEDHRGLGCRVEVVAGR